MTLTSAQTPATNDAPFLLCKTRYRRFASWIPAIILSSMLFLMYHKENGLMYKLGVRPSDSLVWYCKNTNHLALTFDDGPTEYMELAYRILNHRNIPATFYVIGKNALKHVDMVRAMAENPLFMIAGHSFDHPNLGSLSSPAAIWADLQKGFQTLTNITGKRYRHLRPPGGTLDNFGLLANSNYSVDLWSLSVSDWALVHDLVQRAVPDELARYSLIQATKNGLYRKLKNGPWSGNSPWSGGYIYCGHDRKLVFETLNAFLDYIESFRYYKFVRMDECTGIPETF